MLQGQVVVREPVLSSFETSKYDNGKRKRVSEKKDPKIGRSFFEAVVSDLKNLIHCPLQDDVHRMWQDEAIKK